MRNLLRPDTPTPLEGCDSPIGYQYDCDTASSYSHLNGRYLRPVNAYHHLPPTAPAMSGRTGKRIGKSRFGKFDDTEDAC